MENKEQQILQRHLAKFLINDVFNVISEEDILKIRSANVWEHKGQLLNEGQVRALRAEAKTFRESGLWTILKAELLWLAHLKGYVKSQTESDIIGAKLIEYLTVTVDNRLKEMSSI